MPKTPWYEDPQELRKRRTDANITAIVLSRKLGKSDGYIRKIEAGKMKLSAAQGVWPALGLLIHERKTKAEAARRLAKAVPVSSMLHAGPDSATVKRLEVCEALIKGQKELLAIYAGMISSLKADSDSEKDQLRAQLTAKVEECEKLRKLYEVETVAALSEAQAREDRERADQLHAEMMAKTKADKE